MFRATQSSEPPWKRAKGTWKEFYVEDGISASFTCPNCGVVGTLEEHTIHSDGSVEPSVDCPNDCGFHDMVVLEDWIGRNGINKHLP